MKSEYIQYADTSRLDIEYILQYPDMLHINFEYITQYIGTSYEMMYLVDTLHEVMYLRI